MSIQINGDGLDLKVHTKAMATMMLVEAVTNGEAAEGVPCRVRAVHKLPFTNSCTLSMTSTRIKHDHSLKLLLLGGAFNPESSFFPESSETDAPGTSSAEHKPCRGRVGNSLLLSAWTGTEYRNERTPHRDGECEFGCVLREVTSSSSFVRLSSMVRIQIAVIPPYETYSRFDSMRDALFRRASLAFLVYDMTDRDTFRQLENNRQELLHYGYDMEENIVVAVIANKCDCSSEMEEVSREVGMVYAARHNFPYFETSATHGYGMENALMSMVTGALGCPVVNQSVEVRRTWALCRWHCREQWNSFFQSKRKNEMFVRCCSLPSDVFETVVLMAFPYEHAAFKMQPIKPLKLTGSRAPCVLQDQDQPVGLFSDERCRACQIQ